MNELAKQDVPMHNGMVRLETITDALTFAAEVYRSGLAPSGFKTPQAIFVAVQQGAELGLKPMQSLQGIAVINGRTSLYDKTARGLVIASGLCEQLEDHFEGTGDDFTAITTAKRKGMPKQFIGRFSVKDAKVAGLWGKAGPWTQYFKEMLSHKASARALSAGFADILIGLPVFEDIQDVPPERKEPTNPTPTNDPLLELIPEAPKQASNRAVEQSNGNEGTIPANPISSVESANNQASESQPIEIHPDDLDYQASQNPASRSENKMGEVHNEVKNDQPAGPQSVEGTIEKAFPPKTDKQPWTIYIGGKKLAVFARTAKSCFDWLSDGKPKTGLKTKFRADYTTKHDEKYGDQYTLVAIESLK